MDAEVQGLLDKKRSQNSEDRRQKNKEVRSKK
jgi:hypothetical protein